MSAQHPHSHGELVNENVHHEESDINIRAIITFIVVLFAIVIVIDVLCVGLFKLFDKIEDKTQPSVTPLAAAPATLGADFPAPGLQTTPWADLTKLRADEAAFLHGYGWVDQTAGIGRIPIDRAKAILLEKGLPVRPEAAEPTEGTHAFATGESSGGRNLPGGQADKSGGAAAPAANPAAPPAAATVPPAKGPGGL